MVHTHPHRCEDGTTTPLPPQEAEKLRHVSLDPQKVAQLHHREHLDWLHHQIKSNQIVFITYTWLADVNASVAKCFCIVGTRSTNNQRVI